MNNEPIAAAGSEVYDWYVRGLDLLASGSPAAASQLLGRASQAEPGSRSIREALARAHFNAGQYELARAQFAENIAADPVDHYALFGYGLASIRLADYPAAIEHLAQAVAMNPVPHYERALRNARLRAV